MVALYSLVEAVLTRMLHVYLYSCWTSKKSTTSQWFPRFPWQPNENKHRIQQKIMLGCIKRIALII